MHNLVQFLPPHNPSSSKSATAAVFVLLLLLLVMVAAGAAGAAAAGAAGANKLNATDYDRRIAPFYAVFFLLLSNCLYIVYSK